MLSADETSGRAFMTWSIRARLTAWYSLVVVIVLVTGALAARRGAGATRPRAPGRRARATDAHARRRDANRIRRGADAQERPTKPASRSSRPIARWCSRADGDAVGGVGPAARGGMAAADRRPVIETVTVDSTRLRALSRPVTSQGARYVAAVMASLMTSSPSGATLLALGVGVLVALSSRGRRLGRRTAVASTVDGPGRQAARSRSAIPTRGFSTAITTTSWAVSRSVQRSARSPRGRRFTASDSSWPMPPTNCGRRSLWFARPLR